MYLSDAFQKPCSRVKTAHTVNSAAGRCRRTAEVHAGERRAIEAPCGAEEKLPDIERPAIEIAAHQIGIVAFHGGGAENVPPQNALAEARGETLHLRLNGVRHVRRRAVRHVAVVPGGRAKKRAAEECGGGGQGGTAPPAPQWRPSCPPRSRSARGSRPRRYAFHRERGWGRKGCAARGEQKDGRCGALPIGRSRRACRRGARCRRDRKREHATGWGHPAPSPL